MLKCTFLIVVIRIAWWCFLWTANTQHTNMWHYSVVWTAYFSCLWLLMFFSFLPDECNNRSLQQAHKSRIIFFDTFPFHYSLTTSLSTIWSLTSRLNVFFYTSRAMNILHYWKLHSAWMMLMIIVCNIWSVMKLNFWLIVHRGLK